MSEFTIIDRLLNHTIHSASSEREVLCKSVSTYLEELVFKTLPKI